MVNTEIITIGDEILIGHTLDSNSAFIAEKLNAIGLYVNRITSVGDNSSEIYKALDEVVSRSNFVIITGGLGPTKDDITKNVLCDFFNTKLVLNQNVLKHIENLFAGRNIALNSLNVKQAEVPENCTVLPNKLGTAPGMMFIKNKSHVFSLPGVPFEMRDLIVSEVIPIIRQKVYSKQSIIHKIIMVYGIPESMLAEKLEEWENNLPSEIKLAYLPSPGIIKLRFTAIGEDAGFLQNILYTELAKLRQIIPNAIFAEDDSDLPEIVGKLLKEQKKTVSTAESCTGGNIAHLITEVSGSSEYFMGSVVAYSNQIKKTVLCVSSSILEQYGAVSQEVVIEMANNARKIMNTDFAIATSGIAGPTGGTDQKPVGMVWIALASESGTFAAKFQFGKNRERNITMASLAALNMLRLELLK